jgi:hypothetical protein
MTYNMRWLLIIPLLMAGMGCSETPRDGFDAFVRAAHDQNATGLFERFDRKSRAQIRSRFTLEKAEAALIGDRETSEKSLNDFAIEGFAQIKGIEDIREVSRNESAATIEVKDFSGNTQQFQMVFEEDRWRIRISNLETRVTSSANAL